MGVEPGGRSYIDEAKLAQGGKQSLTTRTFDVKCDTKVTVTGVRGYTTVEFATDYKEEL